ncbi:MAG: MBL fold metallo-hydrolase [Gammaproteobacteria bacterium]|nr:MBL fold metallo-hydrolase [Gammaproteobacteria bacterium]
MTIELYKDGNHKCFSYEDIAGSHGVQSNQFLVVDDGHAALIDPGGDLTYPDLYQHLSQEITVRDLDYVIASHQDPDIVSSLSHWVAGTECKIAVPKVWDRFIPHLCRSAKAKEMEERLVSIPDEGKALQIGNSVLVAIPAHYLHSEGNFQFYDPTSKILFSGDLGASFVDKEHLSDPVSDFENHLPCMMDFHRRFMGSNKILRLWVNMVRQLDLEWIVPQHGRSFKGKEMIDEFLDWLEELQCGIDLMTQDNYLLPKRPGEWK